MANVDALYEWLVEGAPGALPPEIADRLGPDIAASGIALHPNVAGRAVIWERTGAFDDLGADELEGLAEAQRVFALP